MLEENLVRGNCRIFWKCWKIGRKLKISRINLERRLISQVKNNMQGWGNGWKGSEGMKQAAEVWKGVKRDAGRVKWPSTGHLGHRLLCEGVTQHLDFSKAESASKYVCLRVLPIVADSEYSALIRDWGSRMCPGHQQKTKMRDPEQVKHQTAVQATVANIHSWHSPVKQLTCWLLVMSRILESSRRSRVTSFSSSLRRFPITWTFSLASRQSLPCELTSNCRDMSCSEATLSWESSSSWRICCGDLQPWILLHYVF